MDGLLTGQQAFQADVGERIKTLERYQLHPPELIQRRIAWETEQRSQAQGELAKAFGAAVPTRTDEQWKLINREFGKTTQLMSRHVSTINREIAVLEKDREAGQASVMVMKEKGPRQTYVLTRGEYDQPDQNQPVDPGGPEVLPALELPSTDSQAPEIVEPESDTVRPWQSAQWIWDNPNAAKQNQGNQPRFFRLVVELQTQPTRAELRVSADNVGVTFVNGQSLGTSEPWMKPAQYDVAKYLVKGRNVIAIKAVNQGGPAGLLASLVVDGRREYGSSRHWKVSSSKSPRTKSEWTNPDYDDSDWLPASELGPPTIGPWQIANLLGQAETVDPDRPNRLTLAEWLTREDHPPDCPRCRQSLLANAVRTWTGVDSRRLRFAGGLSHAS